MFTVQNLQLNRGNTTTNGQGKFTTIPHTYKDKTVTVAIIRAFFPDYLGQGINQDVVGIGDHMIVLGSDTTIFCEILSLAPFVMGVDLFSGASGISVGTPIAAVDNSALFISGETLQAEIADLTHSGIVTAVAQSFGGQKMFAGGLTLLTSGGTPTLLNYYEQYVHTTTFTMSTQTTGPLIINVTRIGNQVTLSTISQITTPAQAVTDVAYTSNTLLPARFRPATEASTCWRILNDGTASFGLLQVHSSGVINVFDSVNGTTNYTPLIPNGFDVGSLTYTV